MQMGGGRRYAGGGRGALRIRQWCPGAGACTVLAFREVRVRGSQLRGQHTSGRGSARGFAAGRSRVPGTTQCSAGTPGTSHLRHFGTPSRCCVLAQGRTASGDSFCGAGNSLRVQGRPGHVSVLRPQRARHRASHRGVASRRYVHLILLKST